MKNKVLSWFIVLIFGALGYWLGYSEQLSEHATKFCAFFLAVAAGLIVEPVPTQQLVFYSVLGLALSGAIPIHSVLAGYSNPIVWLVMAAMFISKGMIKSGLGKRLSLYLIRLLGKSALGVGYAVSITDLLLGAVIPSNLARSGTILFPLIKSICEAYGSTPEKNPRALGSYLMMLGFQADNIICAVLMTAGATNLLLGGLALKFGVKLDPHNWFLLTCVPGLLLVFLFPLILYLFYPPTVKSTPDAPNIAKKELEKMGHMSKQEWIMIGILSMCIALWYLKDIFGVHVAVTGLLGLACLLVFKVLNWHEVVSESKSWNMFIWYGGLVMMADHLEKFGIAQHFVVKAAQNFGFQSWHLNYLLLLMLYFYTQYMFASITAHVLALFVPFLGMAVALKVPVVIATYGFMLASNLCACLTHFGTTPAPIYFGAGYISKSTWWKIGFYLSLFYFVYFWIVSSAWFQYIDLQRFLVTP